MNGDALVLTARFGSSRLPGKLLRPFEGSGTVLDHVILRAKSMSMPTFVFTSTDVADDPIEQLAVSRDVPVFRGSLKNKVDRWKQGFEKFGISRAHLIDVDDPFFSRTRILQSLKLLGQQITVVLPSISSDSGEASEGTSIELTALNTIVSDPGFSKAQDFDVVPWRNFIPSKSIERMTSTHDFPRFRLTLDYAEDYELLRHLANIFGPLVSRRQLVEYLLANPSQVQVNFFRNEQFLENKRDFLSRNFPNPRETRRTQ